MRTTAVAATSLHAIPAYAESLRVGRSLGFSDATSGAGAGEAGTRQNRAFGGDRFVPGEIPESQRDPGLAAYLRAGKAARGEKGNSAEDEEATREVNRLRARDQAVRAHEAAHIGAGGSHIRGAASYTFETGPDGKQYAVGGEVPIDVSPVPGNPQATIQKMTAVRAAALAPGDPSSADVAIANAANQAIAQAQTEAREQQAAETKSANAEPPILGASGSEQPGTPDTGSDEDGVTGERARR